jgi:hypothetical protein
MDQFLVENVREAHISRLVRKSAKITQGLLQKLRFCVFSPFVKTQKASSPLFNFRRSARGRSAAPHFHNYLTVLCSLPKDPRDPSREQSTESRDQIAESREQRAETREQRVENSGQRAESIEQRAESREQRAESREQWAESRKQRASIAKMMFTARRARVNKEGCRTPYIAFHRA